MKVTVHTEGERPGESPSMAGVWDLTALITGFDPAWGSLDGARQTAVITIHHDSRWPRFAGTFTDFTAIVPGEEPSTGNPGTVGGSIHPEGQAIIELFFEGDQSSYWYGKGTLASQRIEGTFGAGGHISGSFVAERRQGK